MKLGFIGAGNMASAIMGGIIGAGLVAKEDIIASDAFQGALDKVQANLGVNVTNDNKKVAAQADILFLAVKPQFYMDVIIETRYHVRPETIIVTIAPGWTLEKTKAAFGKELKIIRTMPNTPAMVLEGMTSVCPNELVKPEDLEVVLKLLGSFGKYEIIAEYMIDAGMAAAGSSPAYVYMMIEALADGAVMYGMPRDKAYKYAAQAVLGSAKMVLETGMHPGALKDMVCSPAGTTIEAVKVLEQEGFRASIIDAMVACVEKGKKM